MKNISIGKLRRLQQCASPRGIITCLALDHRQNLRKALNPANPSGVPDEQLSAFKLEVASALADQATAILLDPEFSAAQAIAGGAVPGNTGLVIAVEATGYAGEPSARRARILPDWSVEKAGRMGASMIKLLVYYHPDSATAPEIEAFTTQVAEDCLRHDLGLMLEPLSYSLTDQNLSSTEKRYVVVETARRLTAIPGVDLFKAEFPLDIADDSEWAAACADVSTASSVPWILLSGAASFSTYLRQVATACQAGASGIAVGRAVWQEAVQMQATERSAFLLKTARSRLARLSALCQALARPWMDYFAADAPLGWYKTY